MNERIIIPSIEYIETWEINFDRLYMLLKHCKII